MVAERQHWWRSAAVAHVAPLVLFMLLSASVDFFRVENSALPWYQRAPEHWLYPVQCVLVGVALLVFRKHYAFKPWRGLGWAAVLAVIGIVIWLLPSLLYRDGLPAWCQWLGAVKRVEGFNPDIFPAQSSAWWATVLLRFFRLVVIVPLVEEIFWRGFLMRSVQAGERDFRAVPFGTHSWKAFWIVTLAVTLIHQPPDYPGAFVWGALVYALAVKTKSLGACVFMHAAGNLLLGLYVLQTKQWGFW